MLACRLKHTAGTWVDPVQPRARGTLHRLIRLWIISDRWTIGPCLHLLTSVGTAVEELGHDVRNTAFPNNVRLDATHAPAGSVCPNGYGAMNGHAETNGHQRHMGEEREARRSIPNDFLMHLRPRAASRGRL